MKTTATVTGPKGKVRLSFAVFAVKQFCKRMGCAPEIGSILAAFQGATRVEAMSEIIRTGVEQATAEAGKRQVIDDFAACEILEAATEKEGDNAFKAFCSSVLNQDYDEWFAQLQARVEAESRPPKEDESENSDGTSEETTDEKKTTDPGP